MLGNIIQGCGWDVEQRKGSVVEWKSSSGGVAQSGEHLLCKQGVRGSNPLTSTKVLAPRPVAQGTPSY